MSWRDLAHSADDAVDAVFGDPITIRPWVKGEFNEGVADVTRSVIENIVGIPVHYPVDTVTPVEGGSKTGPHLIEADERLSIRKAYVEGVRQDDRVEYGNNTYEVTMLSPTNDGERVVLHLTRVR